MPRGPLSFVEIAQQLPLPNKRRRRLSKRLGQGGRAGGFSSRRSQTSSSWPAANVAKTTLSHRFAASIASARDESTTVCAARPCRGDRNKASGGLIVRRLHSPQSRCDCGPNGVAGALHPIGGFLNGRRLFRFGSGNIGAIAMHNRPAKQMTSSASHTARERRYDARRETNRQRFIARRNRMRNSRCAMIARS